MRPALAAAGGFLGAAAWARAIACDHLACLAAVSSFLLLQLAIA